MLIQEDSSLAFYKIQRYTPGHFWINDEHYETSMIVRPQHLAPWSVCRIDDLLVQDFQSIFDTPPSILLLGTGSTFVIPPQTLLAALWEKQIGVEYMDTQKACFTYMALAGEHRAVAACLIA